MVILAGPGPVEAERTLDLLAGLRAHEPSALARTVIVDDGGRSGWPADVAVTPNPRRGRGIGTLGGTCAGTLAGLDWAREHAPGGWVLRLDSDAQVIGPFARAIEDAWQFGDGILGSCHRTCNGEPRDFTAWAAEVRRHSRRIWAFRRPPRRPWYVRPADRLTRRIIRTALANGYAPGEHCLAAGCAISPALVEALAARGWLDDPGRWIAARLGDDVLLGAMTRACGLDLRDLPGVFGLQHIGLPDDPERCVARGFAVVHSLKNDPRHDEAALRAYFAEARA